MKRGINNLWRLVFAVFVIFFIGCNRADKTINKYKLESTHEEFIFKKWLRDTLVSLNNQQNIPFKREISLDKDSLSMSIESVFDTVSNGTYQGRQKEILYALDLLKRNKCLPHDNFRLQFNLINYYYVSQISTFKYEFDSEIKLFTIKTLDSKIQFDLKKGNLISKDTIK